MAVDSCPDLQFCCLVNSSAKMSWYAVLTHVLPLLKSTFIQVFYFFLRYVVRGLKISSFYPTISQDTYSAYFLPAIFDDDDDDDDNDDDELHLSVKSSSWPYKASPTS